MVSQDPNKLKEVLCSLSLPSLSRLGKHFCQYNLILPLIKKPFLPRSMTLYVTYRCNMRCRMCGIWKQSSLSDSEELTPEELDKILADPLFSRLEFVNINGGEPNLREDLPEIAELIVARFPLLTALSLNSNGLPPGKMIQNVEIISRLCRGKKIRFSVSLSLHASGEKYDRISGIKGAHLKIQESFEGIKRLKLRNGFYLSANCVITNLNLRAIDEMLDWSQKTNVPTNFVLGEVRERFKNLEMEKDVRVQDGEHLVLFLRTLARRKRYFFHQALRYRYLADMIEKREERKLACHYALGGLTLGSDGQLCYCPNSEPIGNCKKKSAYAIYYDASNLNYRKNSLLDRKCKTCPVYSFNNMEAEKDLLKLIRFLLFSK
jgi:MoaA/NifB/PqqE/SkfB family radical SAM enzyme